MDKQGDDAEQDAIDSEMEAAFAASFDTDAQPVEALKTDEEEAQAKAVDAPKPQDEKQEQQATPTAPPVSTLSDDQVKLLSAIPKLEQLMQRVDKVDGNYGEVKRLLDSMQKAAATPQGAAAFDASKEGDRLDRDFPEIANGLKSKIDQAVSKIPVGITPEQFETMYVERRQREDIERRNELIKVLETNHPDRFEVQKTPQWKQWYDSLPPYQRDSLENSEDPYVVSGMLSKFKVYRDKQTLVDKKSKQRIESAITPTGVRPSSPSTISDDEAAQQAFNAQFN